MYIKAQLKLTKSQLEKLAKAAAKKHAITIRLSRNQLTGHHSIFITKTQMNDINKAALHRRGVDINFSKSQLAANTRSGAGFFSDLAKKAVGSVADIAIDAGTDALKNVARKGVDKLIGRGNMPCEVCQMQGQGFFSDLAKSAVGSVADVAIDAGTDLLKNVAKDGVKKLVGKGKGKGRKKKQGKGLLPAGY